MSFRDPNSVYDNHKVNDSGMSKKEKLYESNGEQLHRIQNTYLVCVNVFSIYMYFGMC